MKKQLKVGLYIYIVVLSFIALAILNNVSLNMIIKAIIGLTILVLAIYSLTKRKKQ